MSVWQKEISVQAFRRGMHLITNEVEKHLQESSVKTGVLHVFIKHTSAGLTINENADPTVRSDFTGFLDRMVPDNQPEFEHTLEGPDDMPAHIKSSLMGSSVTVPVTDGRINAGTWQGIYLCEFRNHGSSRKLVLTLTGD